MVYKKIFKKRHLSDSFWKQLSTLSYFCFLSGVFCLFSAIGFVTDLWKTEDVTPLKYGIPILFFGLVAVGFAYSFTRNVKFFPVIILAQVLFIAIPFGEPDSMVHAFSRDLRIVLDGFGILVGVILGYVLLLLFINMEGAKYFKLRGEIDLAAKMHGVLLPDIELKTVQLEALGKSRPTFDIGGDLIDFVETPEKVTFYVADVSGHGVAAGLLMGMFKSTFRTLMLKSPSLASLFGELNRVLFDLKTRSMFVTCAALEIGKEGEVCYLTAGHPPILHFSKSKASIDLLMTKQIAVSLKPNFEFSSAKTAVEKGDFFVLLSDGVTETMNEQGELFGLEPLETILTQSADGSASEVHEKMANVVTAFGKQSDDHSLLVIKITN